MMKFLFLKIKVKNKKYLSTYYNINIIMEKYNIDTNATKWLESKMRYAKNIYSEPELKSIHLYLGEQEPSNYNFFYGSSKYDYDIIHNIKTKNYDDYQNEVILKSSEIYGIIKIVIPTGINRSHASFLFKEMMVFLYNTVFVLPTGIKKIKHEKVYMLSSSSKNSWYKFCHINSVGEKMGDIKICTKKENITKEIIPILSDEDYYQVLTACEKIDKQIEIFENKVELLWKNILVPYLSSTQKNILSFLDIYSYNTFFEFMTSIPSYTQLMQAKQYYYKLMEFNQQQI